MSRTSLCTASALTAFVLAPAALAQSIEANFDGPSLDRWMYPFNPTPGVRGTASTFGAFVEEPPMFDNRDGQVLLAYDTSAQIEPGHGATAYTIVSATLVMELNSDLTFVYDSTYDPYTAFLDPAHPDYTPDDDTGHPLELFGTAYRAGFDTLTFAEDSPWGFGDPTAPYVRNAYAYGFDTDDVPGDASNAIREEWDAMPWAIGQIDAVAPGELVPANVDVTFELDVSDPGVQAYLQTALDLGKVDFCVTSLTAVDEMGTETPSYYCRENPLVIDGLAHAAQLVINVEIASGCPGDVDGSGDVGVGDLLAVLGAWGDCPGCAEDIDGDGSVGVSDLLTVLAAWGACS